MSQPQVLFVYNADGTIAGKVKDFLHKVLRPDTYPCQLCAITYGYLGMRVEWREFVATLDADVEFLHRDELRAEHAVVACGEMPAAWQSIEGAWRPLVDAPTMNSCSDLDSLIAVARRNLLSPPC